MPSQQPQGEPTKSIYMPYGASGGGGRGGTYFFTDVDQLDHLITRWTKLRDDIAADGAAIDEAIRRIVPPADDKPSVNQAKAARASLAKGQLHNNAMFGYADHYIQKLTAVRAQYTTTDDNNTETVRNADENR